MTAVPPGKTLAVALTLSASMLLGSTVVWAQAGAPPSKATADPSVNKPFANPDAKKFIATFETESREVYAQRKAIVQALELKPGMAVADIGAGTGLFTRLIADKVGPEGKVFAVDIAEPFLKHIAAQSRKLGQNQVQTVLGSQLSTGLTAGSIDLAFVCDTYHHFENPKVNLASIRRALRPDGVLVVIDFDRVVGKSAAFTLKHVRASKDVFLAEIKAAGFTQVETPDAPRLKENFFVKFRRTDEPEPVRGKPNGK
jgi:ubiquinone/menaquinone biosynthesis C-methylase UbiE